MYGPKTFEEVEAAVVRVSTALREVLRLVNEPWGDDTATRIRHQCKEALAEPQDKEELAMIAFLVSQDAADRVTVKDTPQIRAAAPGYDIEPLPQAGMGMLRKKGR
jgi:hypothetical protein